MTGRTASIFSTRWKWQGAMELFEKAKSVRLRSHHDKYLLADGDEETISQERNGTIRNAKWTVEIVGNSNAIRLKSCFGKYLTASNMPLLLGLRGKKVLQTLPPGRLDSSVEWEPMKEGVQVRLRTRYGQYLRANGGVPPWRNHITHDIPQRSSTQDWILWGVDVVDIRVQDPPPQQRRPSDQIETAPDSEQSDDSLEGSPVKNEGRVIHYSVSTNEDADDVEEQSFSFKGRMVEELKNKLEEERAHWYPNLLQESIEREALSPPLTSSTKQHRNACCCRSLIRERLAIFICASCTTSNYNL